jgi:putative membrane protein
MTVVVRTFALVTACIHVLVFVWESFLITRPAVYSRIFAIPAADVPAIRLWAFGVGFYSLFLALGLIAGVSLWIGGWVDVGRALVGYLCAILFLSGVVLLIADRLGLGRRRGSGVGGALSQGIPSLIALIALAFT